MRSRVRSTKRKTILGNAAPSVRALTTLLLLSLAPLAHSQHPAQPHTQPDQWKSSVGDPLARNPRDWAADAAANEKEAIQFNGVYVRYRIHMVGARGDQIRDVLESKDGTVARLIFKENRPLTSEEDAAEHQRLQDMLDSPSAFAKHVKGDQSGKKLATDLVALMPDAMLFTYTPGQPQRGNKENKGEPADIVMDFKPNPAWNPPTMTSEALTGLQGRVWIDRRTRHMVRLEGDIFRPVNLGFGMVARIAPGGKVTLEQVGLTDQRWIFSHFVEHVTVRALMVKTFKENSEIDGFDFTQVKPMTYQEAIKALLDTPLPHSL
ncbi:hypothetical protein [Granulicella tundricola]|uniref:Uncharacterized protein n=1 Tax=Granulicella tundricola (strain ATCC BAA-1859 / DSM 23138 / MP5ACTX9) TaxID=1198114 RepID=E8X4L0_GRATM|nr:hypothetical protein [Granulicella tundricola]ADW69420.1 hypothetical protein AciX9_2383 [Granulicella tundricola MP5ACTX9]